jgi:hypothetical protein
LEELKLPELRLPEWQTEQAAKQAATRPASSRSTRTRSSARPSQTGGRTSTGSAPQPALDFRGSDYGAFPPEAPQPETLEEELPAMEEAALQSPATDPVVDQPLETAQPPETSLVPEEEASGAGLAPAAASRNVRSNPVFSDETFMLELPDYNPLLE